jgi:hypothetical protein
MTGKRLAPGSKTPDFLSQEGAKDLADRLKKFWHSYGYTKAKFEVVPVKMTSRKFGTPNKGIYTVQSNLVGGVPPR